MRASTLALVTFALSLPTARATAQRAVDPLPTAAEASGFTRTSKLADVRAFLDEIVGRSGATKIEVGTFGKSQEGRDLLHVRVVPAPDAERPADGPLRVMVVADIHGGEVCGKEAVQMLLREIAAGEHAELVAACDLHFVPIYNVDGNERIDPANRPNVNGPVGGLGARENAQGLDLNRDCIKTESPEFRALLGLMESVDPHVLLDLHTTNGSPHGYHLTYAPPLATNVDERLDRYLRQRLLPAVRTAVADRHGYRIFDYGNFSRGEPRAYATFDHRPRFLTNYYGLRNRFAVLSEAYAYEPFETRVRATRAFVIETIRGFASDLPQVLALCAAADARCVETPSKVRFGWDTTLIEGDEVEILVGVWDQVPLEGRSQRTLRRSELTREKMRLQNGFVSRQGHALPNGGWVVRTPTPELLSMLRAHGLTVHELTMAYGGDVELFVPESGDKAPRAPWGAKTRTIELRGRFVPEEDFLTPGTAFVPSHQRLARVAAQMLEPLSEDGLATWGVFEAGTRFAADAPPYGAYPVRRMPSTGGLVFAR
jgi:hypothetical protein